MLTTAVTLLALALPGALPAAAGANPLLSGYGGPGQGNQAILGSALLNGPSGGGGSGGGGGVTSRGTAAAGVPSGGAAGAPAARKPGGASGAAGKGGRRATDRAANASGSASGTPTEASGSAASRALPAGTHTLELPGRDIFYMLLALAALALTGALTRRLTRRSG
ncbi:MAG TPA: hypothetical protein VES97_02905 [Solirubrobacteraceae bacterium]|nr:hypothetical protein [Solirubrobacteraceae bacterium]